MMLQKSVFKLKNSIALFTLANVAILTGIVAAGELEPQQNDWYNK